MKANTIQQNLFEFDDMNFDLFINVTLSITIQTHGKSYV